MAFFFAWESWRGVGLHSVRVTLSLHLRGRVTSVAMEVRPEVPGFFVVVMGGGNELVSLLVGFFADDRAGIGAAADGRGVVACMVIGREVVFLDPHMLWSY